MASLAATDILDDYASWGTQYRSLRFLKTAAREEDADGNAASAVIPTPPIIVADDTSEVAMVTGSAETAQIDSTYAETISELNRYAEYPARWDGYRAEPFDPEVLMRARAILRMAKRTLIKEQIIPALMTTGPASDGSVDVEIRESRRTLFYTIYPDVDVEVAAIAEGAAPIKGKIPFNETALAQWLDWVVGKVDLSKIVADHRLHT
jgi:hypothetical protein